MAVVICILNLKVIPLPFFLLEIFIKIIVHSHKLIRNNAERSPVHFTATRKNSYGPQSMSLSYGHKLNESWSLG